MSKYTAGAIPKNGEMKSKDMSMGALVALVELPESTNFFSAGV